MNYSVSDSIAMMRNVIAVGNAHNAAVLSAMASGLVDFVLAGNCLDAPGVPDWGTSDANVVTLLEMIDLYRRMLPEGELRDRASRVLACGHGGLLTRECRSCDSGAPLESSSCPRIAVHCF